MPEWVPNLNYLLKLRNFYCHYEATQIKLFKAHFALTPNKLNILALQVFAHKNLEIIQIRLQIILMLAYL